MKNKKGFTLIELLAVIVILAIIAAITIPIISSTIEKAKRNAAKNSAYGYVDAVNKLYFSTSLDNVRNQLDDGTYTTTQLEAKGLKVSGTIPSEGWIKVEDGIVTEYTLKFGNYTVSLATGQDIVITKDETPQENPGTSEPSIVVLYGSDGVTPKDKSDVSVGDIAAIGDETFEVINTNDSGNVVLLGEYNLNEFSSNTTYNAQNNGITLMSNKTYLADNTIYMQSPEALFPTIAFSDTEFWYGKVEKEICSTYYGYYGEIGCALRGVEDYLQEYALDSQNVRYIYRTADGQDTDNNIYPILNSYKAYLQSQGANVVDVRLMSYAEAYALTRTQRKINGQSYWLGSEADIGYDGEYNEGYPGYVYYIENKGDIKECINDDDRYYGIRPVIEIAVTKF